MNILFFLIPKSEVAYIFEDETLRQTLEKMEEGIRINNRTAVSKNSIWVRKRLSVTCIKNGNRKDTA